MDARRSDRRGAVDGETGMRPRPRWRRRAAGALVALSLLVAGCSSAATSMQVAPEAGGSTVGGGVTRAAGAPAPAQPGVILGDGSVPGKDVSPEMTSDPSLSQGFADQAKIVKTGTLTLEVKALDDALAAARTAITGLGGYVSGTDEANDGDRTAATIVYRIPAARWDEALQRLRGLATKVVAEQTNAVEVTGQVVDLEARISNLRATESALQGIMAKAIKISDVLEVQAQLSAVQGQIEQLTAQKAHLEDQAAMGTLTVSFGVPVPAVTVTREGWDPAAEVDRAVANLVAMAQGLASFGIWFAIVALPVLVALGVLLALAIVLARRLGVRRPRSGLLPPAAPPAGSPPAAAQPEA